MNSKVALKQQTSGLEMFYCRDMKVLERHCDPVSDCNRLWWRWGGGGEAQKGKTISSHSI